MRALGVGGVVVALFWSSAANAQRRGRRAARPPATQGEAAPSARDAEARNLYQAGRLAFDDGRFEEALTNFRRSFELSDRGELLYNIGAAADRLRRDQEALDAYEQFLVRAPTTPQRRNVEARIRVLRETVAATSSASPAPPIAAAVIPPESGPRQGSVTDASMMITPERPRARGQEVYETWWFWTIIGVVAAGAVVTGVLLSSQGAEQQPLVMGDFGNVVFTLRGP